MINRRAEKYAFQLVVALACIIPLFTGAQGILHGVHWLRGAESATSIDLDSHFHYVSGIFFAVGLGFASCVPKIEQKAARFRLLGLLVMCGGASRLLSLMQNGTPSLGHQLGLVMELIIMPLLMLWQRQLALRFHIGRT